MTVAQKVDYITVDEYLLLERKSQIKHEYVDGNVFAMTGGNRRHNIIEGNIFAILHGFLKGSSCYPFMEAMKARIVEANCFYYPDIMVSCGENDEEADFIDDPVLIVEVLSPSTAAVDRREKLTNYRKLPSLCEYILVHQRKKKVELYRKEHSRSWVRMEFGPGDTLTIKSLPKGELNVSIEAIYEGVFRGSSFEVHEEPAEYCVSEEESVLLDW